MAEKVSPRSLPCGKPLCGLGRYRQSLATLASIIERRQPDLILNFLEPLVGLFNLVRPHPVPVVSVGHHFMLGHPAFVRSPGSRCNNGPCGVTWPWPARGPRSSRSPFIPRPRCPNGASSSAPPAPTRGFELHQVSPGRFLLAYVLNQGYAADILRWHTVFPDVELHCFCEKPKIEPVWHYDSTLFFHKLDGEEFLRMMAQCRGVACTAGFESLNEAAWLGKPLLVVPVENHVEQHLNALDAEKAGLALAATRFDLTPLLRRRKPANLDGYRTWVRRAEPIFLSVLEEATRGAVGRPAPVYSAPALMKPSSEPV